MMGPADVYVVKRNIRKIALSGCRVGFDNRRLKNRYIVELSKLLSLVSLMSIR